MNSFCLLLSVHSIISDLIRIFDDLLDLTTDRMTYYLKLADLENHGFNKTVEFSTEIDENGKATTKKTIYYKVTDHCSQVKKWERVLEERMPVELRRSKIFSKTVKEVESRITGRKTKSCTVGLEVHPDRCLKKIPDYRVGKKGSQCRRIGGSCCNCQWCSIAGIDFE